jgi:uncharacterized Ntn-hydrolase superfamily protein
MTYSIVARDPATGELGVAVQSRAFAAGAACPWARPGVGAVATQSFSERGYGPRGLDLMAAGRAPEAALAELVAQDERRDFRQVAFVAADGHTAAHTGAACISDCGDLARENVSAQGNMLASADVWPAMVETFERTTGPLAERLLDALDAGEAAGGDFRGRQAGGVLVVSGDPDDPPWQPVVDVRVDDHPEPLRELRRLYGVARALKRRGEIGPGASLEEEVEAARAVGLREDEVETTAAIVEFHNGDAEAALRRLRALVAAEPRRREAFDRYERLGFMPPGIVERL